MNKKIAIFGGSFNPPHVGHKIVIEKIIDTFSCDELWIMPSGQRKDKMIDLENHNRIEMLRLLIDELKEKSKVKISTIEIDKSEKTSTIETLEELEKEYPEDEFHFVISTELVPEIKKTWVRGKEVFNRVKFIIVERPGFMKIEEIETPNNSTLIKQDNTIPLISSTKIREIKNPDELNLWLDKKLADYIINNKLYGFKK